MKLSFILILLASSLTTFAKTPTNFNESLLREVEKEIKKDDYSFKKPSSRAPASVQEKYDHPIQETHKIDKNVRQIGPNKW